MPKIFFFMENTKYLLFFRLNAFWQKMIPPPRSTLCICGSLQFYPSLQHLIFRSKTLTKSRTVNKSTKTTQRSKKGSSKARVVWVDNAVPQDTQHESNSDAVTNSTEFESSKYSTPSKCPFSHSVQWFFEFIALSVFFLWSKYLVWCTTTWLCINQEQRVMQSLSWFQFSAKIKYR